MTPTKNVVRKLSILICTTLSVLTLAEAPAPATAPAAPVAKAIAEPSPAEADPSLVLDLPDAVNVPAKPQVKKMAPVPKKMPKELPKQPTLGGGNLNRTIKFDKPIDPNLSLPINTEVSIILSNNKFLPSKFKLREGLPTKLFFTTVNKAPGALIIERLQVQRWIAKERPAGESEADRARWESSHEINANKVTEVVIEPKAGTYNFHDALTGASGEITVE